MAVGRRKAIMLAVVLVIACAGAYGWWRWSRGLPMPFGSAGNADYLTVSGNIEAHQSVLSFAQVQAPITHLPFDEGRFVEAGTILARVDERLYRQQIEIDLTNLQVAIAQIAANESSLAAARGSVAQDEYDLAQKQRDYARAEALVKSGAVSAQARDQALTDARTAAAVLARDRALVQQAMDNIRLAQASEAAARARLALDEITLAYTVLRAPFAGVISVRQAELGQLAGPGVAILTLDDLDHVWLRAYVNERDLGKVRLDQPAKVITDTYPDKVYPGRISFISPQAEFTPKTVETHAERVTLVYRIRIDIDNPTHELLPGMPADAVIARLPPGR
ncbi:MAG: HlyD family secretion protein [Solirubrobacterales bacterium]